jgi:hypothetical protein
VSETTEQAPIKRKPGPRKGMRKYTFAPGELPTPVEKDARHWDKVRALVRKEP